MIKQLKNSWALIKKTATSELMRVVIFLLVVVALFNWKVVFSQKVFFQNFTDLADFELSEKSVAYGVATKNVHFDVQQRYFPMQYFGWESMHKSRLPLWDPDLLGGAPHFATGQTAVFELGKLALYWLPLDFLDFWDLLILVRFFLAGFFLYLFLKRWKLSGYAAVFGAIAFMFSAFNVAWIGQQRTAVLLWLPFLLWCFEGLVRQAKTRYFILLAFGFAATFFSGLLDTTAQVVLFFWLYAAVRLLFTDEYTFFGTKHDVLRSIVMAFLLGGLVAGVQLLPYLEYLGQTVSSGIGPVSSLMDFVGDIPRIVGDNMAHISDFTLFFSPSAAQSQISGTWIFPHTNYSDAGLYVGLMTIVFMCMGIFGNFRRKFTWFLVGAALLSLAGAIFFPDLAETYRDYGLFTFINSRIRWVLELSIIVLAAFGFDFLRSHLDEKRFFPFLLIALLFFELFRVHSDYIPVKTRDEIDKSNATISFILDHQRPGERILATDDVLYPNAALIFGLSDARGADTRYIRNFLDATHGYLENKEGVILAGARDGLFWDAMNVRYILTQDLEKTFGDEKIASPSQQDTPISYTLLQTEPVAVVENTDVMPKAYVSYNIDSFATQHVIKARMLSEDFSWRHSVLIHKNEVLEEGNIPIQKEDEDILANQPVQLTLYEPEHIEAYVRSKQAGYLVLSDNYYPGWVAKVNEVDVPIYLANGTHRSISVPAGNSQVEFEFKPLSLAIGTGLSALGVLLISLIAMPRFWWYVKQAWTNVRAYVFERKRRESRRQFF